MHCAEMEIDWVKHACGSDSVSFERGNSSRELSGAQQSGGAVGRRAGGYGPEGR